MSGKSTYVMKYKQRDDLVVDVDSIFSAITGMSGYDKPNALLTNALAVRDILLDNIRTRYGKWNNAWIIGGYADIYMRDKIINELGAEPILIKITKFIKIGFNTIDLEDYPKIDLIDAISVGIYILWVIKNLE